ncbi:MAG: c-type cytochrome [Acidimicrobiia bacterium]|nr:c-type cytochrome [Acidimicrobiia bacterium]MDX2465721.1 c-type cytochrome [Acidimicrobiia bacterium]
MQEILNQIAADTGVPAELLERAARARATVLGIDAEALVSGWGGGETPAPTAAADPTPAAPADPTPAVPAEPAPAPSSDTGAGKLPEALVRRSAAAKAKREGRPLDEVLVEMGLSPAGGASAAPVPSVADAASSVADAAGTGAPTSTAAPSVPDAGADEAPVEEEEPQPVFAGFPRWLAASFIIIPMIALLYAGLAPNGPDCGTSGQLAINPINGEAQSCGGDASPFFSLGGSIYDLNCAACHGDDGGGGVGPSFLGGAVLQTFSACEDHVSWVTLGSANWPDVTYGDTNKPVGGTGVNMAGYEGTLSEQEIAAVALYERVAFGGQDITEAEATCGLVEAAEG